MRLDTRSGWGREVLLDGTDERRLQEGSPCVSTPGLSPQASVTLSEVSWVDKPMAEVDDGLNLSIFLPPDCSSRLPITIGSESIVGDGVRDRWAKEHYFGIAGDLIIKNAIRQEAPEAQ